MQLPSPQTQKISPRVRDGNHWAIPNSRQHESQLRTLNNHESTSRALVVDRDDMSSNLLASTLARDGSIQADAVRSVDLLDCMADGKSQLVVIGADLNHETRTGFDLAHAVRRAHPSVPVVILLNRSTHDDVINAFRCGARGVFSRQQPVADFLDCVEHARKGFIWAGAQETTFLLDAFRSIPSPDMAVADESSPLTQRELEVVKCAARGKTNKVIASELGLSEHTVKNYLFRAFEKLGVSNRIELLFYLTLRGHTFGAAGADDPEPDLRD